MTITVTITVTITMLMEWMCFDNPCTPVQKMNRYYTEQSRTTAQSLVNQSATTLARHTVYLTASCKERVN